MGVMLAFGAMAQMPANPVVPEEGIRFWTGTGSNSAIISVTWNDSTAGNVAVVWGVRWNGTTASVAALMDTIAAYDNNLTIERGNSTYTLVNNLTYVNAAESLNLVGLAGWWWYNWKDDMGEDRQCVSAADDMVQDGDFVDWLPMNPTDYSSQVADRFFFPVDPNAAPLPEESTIAASDILYWVGEGSNQAILAVNWADTALAWGYKFDGSKSVSDMLNAIAAADSRFGIEIGDWGLDDIYFVRAAGDTLRKQEFSYWESKNNGQMDAGMNQPLNNGDLEKWAEPAAGIVSGCSYLAEYTYWSFAYTYYMTIHPVSAPATEGIADVEGFSMSVWPNPAAAMVTVSGFCGNHQAVLYDMRGSVVATYNVNGETRLDLSSVANGVYMLRVADKAAKIVVRH